MGDRGRRRGRAANYPDDDCGQTHARARARAGPRHRGGLRDRFVVERPLGERGDRSGRSGGMDDPGVRPDRPRGRLRPPDRSRPADQVSRRADRPRAGWHGCGRAPGSSARPPWRSRAGPCLSRREDGRSSPYEASRQSSVRSRAAASRRWCARARSSLQSSIAMASPRMQTEWARSSARPVLRWSTSASLPSPGRAWRSSVRRERAWSRRATGSDGASSGTCMTEPNSGWLASRWRSGSPGRVRRRGSARRRRGAKELPSKQPSRRFAPTIADVRDIAHGIYPAALADMGLGAALGALAEDGRIPYHLDAIPAGRLPPAIESAAYFVISEAPSVSGAQSARVRAVVEDGTPPDRPHGSTAPMTPT